jgi:hypothetical protein
LELAARCRHNQQAGSLRYRFLRLIHPGRQVHA